MGIAPPYGYYGGDGRSGERENFDGSLYIDPLTEKPVSYYKTPKDALDELFRDHDLAYDRAQNLLDIMLADITLLKHLETLNPQLLDADGEKYRLKAIVVFHEKLQLQLPLVILQLIKNSIPIPSFIKDNFSIYDPRQNTHDWYADTEYRLHDPSQSDSYRIVYLSGCDPLALDLDGDGLETKAMAGNSGALFDHNNDGIRSAR